MKFYLQFFQYPFVMLLAYEPSHCVSKTSHRWLAITLTHKLHERILICFGRNVTDKVSNQKPLY